MRWTLLLSASLLPWSWAGCDGPARDPERTVEPPSATPGAAPTSPAAEARLVEVAAADVPALLRAQPGRLLLVNVWSTWCEPCVEEFPELLRVARDYEDRGLGVLFLSVDPRVQHEAALAFLREQGAPMPGYVKVGSDEAFIEALHPDWSGTLPATMLFDAQRRPQALWERSVDRATLRAPLERLLAPGPPSPRP